MLMVPNLVLLIALKRSLLQLFWSCRSVYDSKRSIEILQVFLAESKFVHDLNFDFFLFERLPPFFIVDVCFRTLVFNSSFVCNI